MLSTIFASVALLADIGSAAGAPELQLPWPTGEQHRIWGGNTYGCGTHGGTNYYAIDLQFSTGQSVAATAAGTVVIASIGFNGGAGNYVAVDHGVGYVSRYLHLRPDSLGGPWPAGIFVGATVNQGQLVGYSGGTGGVPPHLHFDFKLNGQAYRAEPMSGGPVAGEPGFGWYGFSVESGLGCGNNGHDPSPYWTSCAPPDWPVPPGDTDCDGYPDTVAVVGRADEAFLGTDPTEHCAADTIENNDGPGGVGSGGIDHWPLDMDDNRKLDLGDILKYNLPWEAVGPEGPATLYKKRLDLDKSNVLDLGDALQYNLVWEVSCVP